jgi:hypothetical protein
MDKTRKAEELMKSVRVGGDLEHVTIALSDRDPERDAQLADHKYYDSNWVSARVEIAVGGFRGAYDADLFRADFPDFRDALTKLYSFASNDGKFETIENQLRIEIRGDRRGNFEATGVARDSSDGNCLEFKLEFDQTYIPRMLAELDAIIAAYPVLGKKPKP